MPMVKRNDGTIAIQWVINTNGKTVRIGNTDRYYVFIPKNNVVMAWVQEQDIAQLLVHKEKTCNCNNGTFKNAFQLAPIINVNVWNYNNRDMGIDADYTEVPDGV